MIEVIIIIMVNESKLHVDFEKRKNDQKEKEAKLRNPLFFINPHRLLVKNLGPHITSNYLKQICL